MASVTAKLTGGERMGKVLASIGAASRRGKQVRVGYLEGRTYPDGTPVAQVAFWQEFGTPGAQFPIPPRPTFRKMIAAHSREWGPQLGEQMKAADYDSERALGVMGKVIQEELIDSILTADVAELSKVTLMLRKMRDETHERPTLTTVYEAIRRVKAGESGADGTRAKRLVDSGVLLHTPDFEVVG